MFVNQFPFSPPFDLMYYPKNGAVLRATSVEVSIFNQALRRFVEGMKTTMQDHNGIGLAAPQVGVLQRIFVMKVGVEDELPQVFINPTIVEKSEELIEYEEGCLSIPEVRANVQRRQWVNISATDEWGTLFSVTLFDLPAICAQHEIDHLKGVLLIDHLSRLKRFRIERKLAKSS